LAVWFSLLGLTREQLLDFERDGKMTIQGFEIEREDVAV
jgi:hypothetical protein